MHVLIASGRWVAGRSTDPLARAEELTRVLAAAGHASTHVPAPARKSPRFRRVSAWLHDPLHERDLAVAIRAVEPDVVHVVGFASGTSTRLPWVARALGLPCTLEVEAADILCHRGDLVHAAGEPCRLSDHGPNCVACCLVPTPGRRGLSRAGALLARAARVLRDLSPFPTELALRNRRDAVAAGLAVTSVLVVRDEPSRQAAISLGIEPARISADRSPAALLALWLRLQGHA